MARLRTVSVSYDRKVNLGDFNALTVSCTLWVQIEPGDDDNAVMAGMWDMARANCKQQIERARAKPGVSTIEDATYLGLLVKGVNPATGEIVAPETETHDEEGYNVTH